MYKNIDNARRMSESVGTLHAASANSKISLISYNKLYGN